MIRVVLDANVLISGAIATARSSGPPGHIIAALRDDEFGLVLSHAILNEVRRNLPNVLMKMGLERDRADHFEIFLSASAEIVQLTQIEHGVASHPEDDYVLATAVLGEVEFLVTGDKQLLALNEYRGVKIITPRYFVEQCLS